MARDACPDCFVCDECERKVCHYAPMCEHQRVCDTCYPNGCADCVAQVEADELAVP
jgi:hypothetical protein